MPERLLDDETLASFRDELTRRAPEVLRCLGHGASEDEIVSTFEAIGVTPSKDAIAWWGFWNVPAVSAAEARSQTFVSTFHAFPLPGWEFIGLQDSARMAVMLREVADEVMSSMHQAPGPGDTDRVDERSTFRSTWIPLFYDGGRAEAVLDCASPDEPSVVRECWAETFSGPDWGRPLCASLDRWIAEATEMLQRDDYRYDPGVRLWVSGDRK